MPSCRAIAVATVPPCCGAGDLLRATRWDQKAISWRTGRSTGCTGLRQ